MLGFGHVIPSVPNSNRQRAERAAERIVERDALVGSERTHVARIEATDDVLEDCPSA
jgi:hypothetical protein